MRSFLERAELLSQGVNFEDLASLSGQEQDIQRPEYGRIKDQLATMQTNWPLCCDIAILGRRPTGVVFAFVDSHPANSSRCLQPGKQDVAASDVCRDVFSQHESQVEATSNSLDGTIFSAYVPILDRPSPSPGTATPAEAEALVKEAVDCLKTQGREAFFKEIGNPKSRFIRGDLYVFVYDDHMTMMAHPVRPDLVGKNLLNQKDWDGGRYFRREIQEISATHGSGWVSYEYPHPLSKAIEPKTTYFEKSQNLIVCAGAYKGTGRLLGVLNVEVKAPTWTKSAKAALPEVAVTLVALLSAIVGFAGHSIRSHRILSGSQNVHWMWQNMESLLSIAIGSALSTYFALLQYQANKSSTERDFRQVATIQTATVKDAVNDLRDVQLQSLTHFLSHRNSITLPEFQIFTKYLVKNSGVKAWEWIPIVPSKQREQFEQSMQQEIPGFHIWQKDASGQSVPANGRPYFYPVCYVAPEAPNSSAIGFDLGSENKRRIALVQAWKYQLPTATDPVTLFQDGIHSREGILIFDPVTNWDGPENIKGFAVTSVYSDMFLRNIRQSRSLLVKLDYLTPNGTTIPLGQTFGANQNPDITPFTRPVLAFGRVFQISAFPGSTFTYTIQPAILTAISGLGITALISLVLALGRRRGQELERLVAERTASLEASTAALKDSEELHKYIIQTAIDGFWMIDADGKILEANTSYAKLVGYTVEELIGMSIFDFVANADEEECRTRLRRIAEAGFFHYESQHKTKDGRVIDVEVNAKYRSKDKRYAVFTHDITERKQFEDEMLATNEQLEATIARANELALEAEMASIAKSDFLSNMSHEIRTPMNGIIGMSGLLMETPLSPQQRRYAETVRSSGEALLAIINDILDFSKIEAGKIEIEAVPFNLGQCLEEIADVLALRASDKGLEFICALDPNAPKSYIGDPTRIRQVLINLAGNAVKFTRDGEVSLTASLLTKSDTSATLQFQITDTGVGIPTEKLGRLFQKFSQADTSITRQFGGTGLGLAISKELVELMGGKIEVQSQEGKGSRFWFTLNLPLAPEWTAADTSDTSDLVGKHILLCDDNQAAREVLRRQLISWGLRCEEAPDGPSSLTALNSAILMNDPFEIAIIDMRMPVMDGATLARIIRHDPKFQNIRLLLITSLGQFAGSSDIAEMGFEALLTKPIRSSELLRGLRRGQSPAVALACTQAHIPLRVLVAEDNQINQQVISAMLDKLGVKFHIAENGRQAIAALQNETFQLVLMDVQMPEMDGITATMEIRKLESGTDQHIPIIALTANAIKGDQDECLAAGMDDYLQKPLAVPMLIQTLEKWGTRLQKQSPSTSLPQSRTAQVWNKSVLLERMSGDEDLANKMISSFSTHMPKQLDALKKAIAVKDVLSATRTAHSIKGAAANIGAEIFQETAAAIENLGKDGSIDDLPPLIPQLEAAYSQFQAHLDSLS